MFLLLATNEIHGVALIAILTEYKLGISAKYPQDKLIILADEALLAFDLKDTVEWLRSLETIANIL